MNTSLKTRIIAALASLGISLLLMGSVLALFDGGDAGAVHAGRAAAAAAA